MAYIVMDVGGNYIKSGWMEGPDQVRVLDPVPTPQNQSDLLEAFQGQLKEVLKQNPSTDFQGVALSHAGIVDDSSGVARFNDSLPFMKGFNYRDFIGAGFSLPVHLINDGQAACLAEARQGALKGVKNGASLTLGTGLGLGIIINGDIYQGSHGLPGEVSFILPHYRGDPLLWSASVFEWVRPANEILQEADRNDARPVFRAIQSGAYPEIEEMFQQFIERIATLVYNLHVILDLQVLAIGGGVSNEDLVVETLKEVYQAMYTNHPSSTFSQESIFQPTEIRVCQMRNHANLIGAYYYFVESDD